MDHIKLIYKQTAEARQPQKMYHYKPSDNCVSATSDSSREEIKPPTALSMATLLTSCAQQCAILARRLESTQKRAIVVRQLESLKRTDQGEKTGPILSLSLSVVRLRLRLWGQLVSGVFSDLGVYCSGAAHPFRVLVKINGIICELDVMVNTILQDTRYEVREVLLFQRSFRSRYYCRVSAESICARQSPHTAPEYGIKLASYPKSLSP